MTIDTLKQAKWLLRASTQCVFSVLEQGGYQARVVGGAVRNTLLGVEISDIDFATTALPEQVIALAQKQDIHYIPTGLAHGTVSLVIDGEVFEITTLRIDQQADGRHAVVSFTDDWAADAMRRDFTVNALYVNADGTLFDPLGGFPDIAKGRVAFIGEAKARIEEDYLRILRFFRFYAQYGLGDIDRVGYRACIAGGQGLRQISGERILVELMKMLVAPRGAEAVRAIFDSGLVGAMQLPVPRLARFLTMIALEEEIAQEPNALSRLGALFVDVPEDITRLDKRLRLSKQQKQCLAWFAMLPFEDWFEAQALREFLYYNGSEAAQMQLVRFLLNRHAELKVSDYQPVFAEIAQWQKPRFPIAGQDLIARGFKSGFALGQVLKTLERRWVKSGFTLSKQALLTDL